VSEPPRDKICAYCAFEEADCVPTLGAMENWTLKWPVSQGVTIVPRNIGGVNR
jgi:hypothetical protein